jgi:hypothetical protein
MKPATILKIYDLQSLYNEFFLHSGDETSEWPSAISAVLRNMFGPPHLFPLEVSVTVNGRMSLKIDVSIKLTVLRWT